MWLVNKGAGDANGREPIADALSATLRIWYTGQGDHRDEAAALLLVRHAHKNNCWLACDCHSGQLTPMLAPALLTGADTYYLRRLTGGERPEHSLHCPFFREQTLSAASHAGQKYRNPPEGFFAVLRPPALSLAQAPDDDGIPVDNPGNDAPRLAKLMWRLLELSTRTIIPAEEQTPRAISDEFSAVRTFADRIDVAPGLPLSRLLFTHPRDWESKRIFAILRDLAKNWPKGHEPQAFFLVFARKVHEHSIETAEGTIDLATRLRHPRTRIQPVSGPDLALVAIGEHPDGSGYGALRAWAQPVHSGHRFIPVDDDFDRTIIETLIAARRILAKQNIALTSTKPVFDQMTPEGPIRPSWMLSLTKGEQTKKIILDPNPPGTSEWPDKRRQRALAFLGEVIPVRPERISYLTQDLAETWGN